MLRAMVGIRAAPCREAGADSQDRMDHGQDTVPEVNNLLLATTFSYSCQAIPAWLFGCGAEPARHQRRPGKQRGPQARPAASAARAHPMPEGPVALAPARQADQHRQDFRGLWVRFAARAGPNAPRPATVRAPGSPPNSFCIACKTRRQRKKLGQRRVAIAHQGVERAAAVALPDQRQAQVGAAADAEAEHLRLDPLGALEPPRRAHDPAGEDFLERAHRRQLLEDRRFHRGERLDVLVIHQVLVGAKPVPEGVPGRTGLAFGRTRTMRFRAVPAAGRGARGRQADAHDRFFLVCRGLRVATRRQQNTSK